MPYESAHNAFLVFDIETIPDGNLIRQVKYPEENLTPHQAVIRAQDEARSTSFNGSDFLPLSFHLPVAVCVARVGSDFRLKSIACLDDKEYRPKEMVRQFWEGLRRYAATLVSFNGRTFDLPVLELTAFRYGLGVPHHFSSGKAGSRNRYGERHIDLMEFFTNYGAFRLAGGLNLLSKLIGLPGKVEMKGSDVYSMIMEQRHQLVNEYCSFDVLDTYFVFLRTRVLTGDISLEQEHERREEAKLWLASQSTTMPQMKRYLSYFKNAPDPQKPGADRAP